MSDADSVLRLAGIVVDEKDKQIAELKTEIEQLKKAKALIDVVGQQWEYKATESLKTTINQNKRFAEFEDEIKQGLQLALGQVVAAKLAGNIVKEEFHKGQAAAWRALEAVLTSTQ